MKIKNIFLNGMAVVSFVATTSCSSDFLEKDPNRYLGEGIVSETIKNDPSLISAYINGAYTNLFSGGELQAGHDDFGIRAIKLATELYCEDIAYPNDAHFFCYDYQLDNRMGDYRRVKSSWNQLYKVIDDANVIISLLKPSEGEQLSDLAESMLGQAYTLRAYCYFWAVNIWQHPYSVYKNAPGIPLKTESEYRKNRVSVSEVYDLILSDINLGYNYLEGKGYIGNNKMNISEYSAAGIFANILMFTEDYEQAAKYADLAIEGGKLNNSTEILSGYNSLDLPEAIWGYSVNNENTTYYASLFSHIDPYMIGYGGKVGYRKLIGSYLYSQISDNDIRKQWFGYNAKHNINGVKYDFEESKKFTDYIQNKYLDKYTCGTGAAFTSDYIYMTIAEMYYIAAEAYFLAGNTTEAEARLTTIMSNREEGYSAAAAGRSLYDEICIQKRIDTWMDGCRYLDVKRRGYTVDRSLNVNNAESLTLYDAIKFEATDYRMIMRFPIVEMENNDQISETDDNK